MSNDIFWKVTAVFDPDGTGQDFAYTVGLGDRGRPELHMWARPTHGDDAGGDFALSMRDMGHLLNEFALDYMADTLKVGDSRAVEVDGGMTTLTFQLADPVPKRDLEAFMGTSDDVVAVRWSLSRPPAGRDTGVDDQARWSAAYARAIENLDPVEGLPPLLDVPAFDTADELGPLSAWVVALAHHVATADPYDVIGAVADATEDADAVDPAHTLGQLSVLARTYGRGEALRSAQELAVHAMGSLAGSQVCDDAVYQCARDLDMSTDELDDPLRRMVLGWVLVYLQSAVLADRVGDQVQDAACHVWRAVGGMPVTTND